MEMPTLNSLIVRVIAHKGKIEIDESPVMSSVCQIRVTFPPKEGSEFKRTILVLVDKVHLQEASFDSSLVQLADAVSALENGVEND